MANARHTALVVVGGWAQRRAVHERSVFSAISMMMMMMAVN